MIEFTKSYKTDDGQLFDSIDEAQIHELESFLALLNAEMKGNSPTKLDVAGYILKNKGVFIDILTTTPNSKPKARSIHGGTKNRKKTVITDASTSIDSVSNVPNSKYPSDEQ
jgi:hypothetical protein